MNTSGRISQITGTKPPEAKQRRVRQARLVLTGPALLLLILCWLLLWSQDSFWNPLLFMGTWIGATVLMYVWGKEGYPGPRRHALLSALSVPLWWWFELVNSRVGNWEYLGAERYSDLEYMLMGTVAFSTVIPALDAAWRFTGAKWYDAAVPQRQWQRSRYAIQVTLGAACQVLVFALPDFFFPFVWVAPFLILDGLTGYSEGRSLTHDLLIGKWRLAIRVALAGILCGFLWEFWNYWATPKWVYHVPFWGFIRLFEMPILGYVGYIPFVWSVYQLLQFREVSLTSKKLTVAPLSDQG